MKEGKRLVLDRGGCGSAPRDMQPSKTGIRPHNRFECNGHTDVQIGVNNSKYVKCCIAMYLIYTSIGEGRPDLMVLIL